VTFPGMRNLAARGHTKFCFILRSEMTKFGNIYNECWLGRMYRGKTVLWGQSFVHTKSLNDEIYRKKRLKVVS